MLNLRVVQGDYGDCLIVEYGTQASPRYMLIDGGPEGVFNDHLQHELRRIDGSGGKLDLLAISHVDGDHIIGVLDALAHIRQQRADNEPDLIKIDTIWHNSFSDAIDPGGEIAPQLNGLLGMAGIAAPAAAAAIAGVEEGHRVRQLAGQLGIPVNTGFAANLICVDDAPDEQPFENIKVRIVGPTRKNLDDLRTEWLEWLDEFGPDIASANPKLQANADKSVPNLSSLMFIVSDGHKTILFTGDGRSDHLLEGLRACELLDDEGRLHVDVLKVMHHGSDRNATKTFFKKVTADTYVVPANGHPDNPDLATLIWIVEAAKAQGREIHLVFTSRTPSVKKLKEEYPPDEFGYRLTVLPPDQHSLVLELTG